MSELTGTTIARLKVVNPASFLSFTTIIHTMSVQVKTTCGANGVQLKKIGLEIHQVSPANGENAATIATSKINLPLLSPLLLILLLHLHP